MLLSITTTHEPATDLGFLLYKHPERFQSFDLSWGQAHIFYPEANEDRCTACMLLDVDPVRLVRAVGKNAHAPMQQYVNDRPWVASSFFSVAISQVLGSALSGTSRDRPELAETEIPLEATLSVLPCRGGEDFLRGLFEPLGYEVEATRHELDREHPEWGESRYFEVTLRGEKKLTDLLSHLYVLVPVLDDDKHYYVAKAEVEKLLRHGEGWLADHPMRDAITKRYLERRRHLVSAALIRLEEVAEAPESAIEDPVEKAVEKPLSLHQRRLQKVTDLVVELGAQRVLDLGCGSGKLIRKLLSETSVSHVLGVDVSVRALEIAARRLKFDRMSDQQRARVELVQGSAVYKDPRLKAFDVACVVEVIEHLDENRLDAFEYTLFGDARPSAVIITTPNAEYNALFETLPAGEFRHRDHRFEWTRDAFQQWCERVAESHGYAARYFDVGDVDPTHGPPTQGVVFEREGA